MSIVWQDQGAKVGDCLFGFWGPVPGYLSRRNLQAKPQQRQTTQGSGVPVSRCLSLARSSGPHPWLLLCYCKEGGEDLHRTRAMRQAKA